jgi:hypothetical protein
MGWSFGSRSTGVMGGLAQRFSRSIVTVIMIPL